MRSCHYPITAPQVQAHALERIQTALRLGDHGRLCSAAVVLTVLLMADLGVLALGLNRFDAQSVN